MCHKAIVTLALREHMKMHIGKESVGYIYNKANKYIVQVQVHCPYCPKEVIEVTKPGSQITKIASSILNCNKHLFGKCKQSARIEDYRYVHNAIFIGRKIILKLAHGSSSAVLEYLKSNLRSKQHKLARIMDNMNKLGGTYKTSLNICLQEGKLRKRHQKLSKLIQVAQLKLELKSKRKRKTRQKMTLKRQRLRRQINSKAKARCKYEKLELKSKRKRKTRQKMTLKRLHRQRRHRLQRLRRQINSKAKARCKYEKLATEHEQRGTEYRQLAKDTLIKERELSKQIQKLDSKFTIG